MGTFGELHPHSVCPHLLQPRTPDRPTAPGQSNASEMAAKRQRHHGAFVHEARAEHPGTISVLLILHACMHATCNA
eukprot:365980-Chlamydomonas_euryale.AAC.8